MILTRQITRIQDRTQQNNVGSIIDELNSAQDFIWNRIITNNSNILKVDDCELTMAAETSSYDLGANVTSGTLVAIKWLGTKFAAETVFNPVGWADSSSDEFILADQSQQAATNSPVLCASENFTQVRFAPPLPAGTMIRVDYIYTPTELSLSSTVISDLPAIMHECMTDKATAQTFINIDDMTRAAYWEGQAMSKLLSAQNSLRRRQYQQTPQTRSSLLVGYGANHRGPNP